MEMASMEINVDYDRRPRYYDRWWTVEVANVLIPTKRGLAITKDQRRID